MKKLLVIQTILIISITINCAQHGYISDHYAPDFYKIPKLRVDGPVEINPNFIIYGDNRTGYRLQETFLRKNNWLTWKMVIFPFYQVYLLGNGLVGAVNYLRSVPDYGFKEQRRVRDALYYKVMQDKIDFLMNIGDMPTDGRYPSHWASFLKINKHEKPLVLKSPYLPVIGNHEHANDPNYGSPNFQAIFDYPPFYVLDFPDVAIFVVDSDIIIDQYQDIDDSEQDKLFEKWFTGSEDSWLEKELGSHNQPFKILIMHHPIVSFGKHHSDWLNTGYGENLIQKRKALIELFFKYNVQLVFSGHEHYYEHNILQNRDQQSEIHIVISGGGGVPVRDLVDESTIAAVY